MMYCTEHHGRYETSCARCDQVKVHLAWVAAKKLENLSVSGIEAEVCADIALRQAKGISKYKTTVADNPLALRDWLQHGYEEALDMAIYLKRAMYEIDQSQDDGK